MCDFPNREAAMVICQSDEEGKPTVWCDPCIADIVQALNECGIRTMASCCGHGKQHGSIVLADDRELVIRPFKPLVNPEGDAASEANPPEPDPLYEPTCQNCDKRIVFDAPFATWFHLASKDAYCRDAGRNTLRATPRRATSTEDAPR